jgi:hypothetical protein
MRVVGTLVRRVVWPGECSGGGQFPRARGQDNCSRVGRRSSRRHIADDGSVRKSWYYGRIDHSIFDILGPTLGTRRMSGQR